MMHAITILKESTKCEALEIYYRKTPDMLGGRAHIGWNWKRAGRERFGKPPGDIIYDGAWLELWPLRLRFITEDADA